MSTWNRTGTIDVTNASATVTGTGVDWSDVSEGDALHAPDGEIYEIASVTGSTLTLVDAYAGSTASGQAYAIQPTRGVTLDLRSAVRALIEGVEDLTSDSNIAALADLTGAADKLPYFSGATTMALADLTSQARTLLGSALLSRSGNNYVFDAAARITGGAVTQTAIDATIGRLMTVGAGGVCGDAITLTSGDNLNDLAVSGLYFNPSSGNTSGNNYPIASAGSLLNIRRSAANHTQRFSAYPGTGTPPAANVRVFERSRGVDAWSPWVEVYHQGRVLGTVSQSGGVPTGAVIQNGSSSNGWFVRFADGTQICWHGLSSSDAGAVTWTYPAVFAGAVNGLVTAASTAARIGVIESLGTSSLTFSVWNIAGARTNASTRLFAIGRWY